ncbi:unnamed protein product [Clavelina lepadiformis]|uniref:Uncharacterized protein n=1 Tax=Clavelina lepadiformis TaxID=159417 RepID=A0ABP0GLC0_CLALP
MRLSISKVKDVLILMVLTGLTQIRLINTEFTVKCISGVDSGFEQKTTWSDNCARMCRSPCNSTFETLNSCTNGIEYTSCGSDSTCIQNQGCVCDSPVYISGSLENAFIRSITCSNTSVIVLLNKCVLNLYGFKLANVFIGQPTVVSESEYSSNPPNATCYGTTTYKNGPTYRLAYRFGESNWCNTIREQNSTILTFKNAIQGISGGSTSSVDRSTRLFAPFQCSYYRTFYESVGTVLPSCGNGTTLVNGTCV